MKKFAILGITLAIALFVNGVLAQSQESKKVKDEPAREHEWLKQLVGEWDTTWKMYMAPDQPPAESTGTDSVRALGGHWIVAEARSTMMGAPYSGILSLGYNAQKRRFNGTWIDSFGGHLWIYKGTLNDAGDTLTLETKGPSLQAAEKTARFREVIRITGKDSRTFNSSFETEDGKWVKIVTIEYRRKK